MLTDREEMELRHLLEADEEIHSSRLFPDKGEFRRELYPKHLEFFRLGKTKAVRAFIAANRVGKALRDGTPVATPGGWVPIERLKIGDVVIAGNGEATTVTGVYPQGVKQLYRVSFQGGNSIDCCGEHLWVYKHPRARYPYRQSHKKKQSNPFFGDWSVGDTRSIIAAVGESPITRRRVVLPTCKPWDMERKDVPLDAYAMGLLIGDGSFRGGIRYSSVDPELLTALAEALPDGCRVRKVDRCNYSITVGNIGGVLGGNPIVNIVRSFGMMGCLSNAKFVPDTYKLNDAATRLAMLQGLMDTDGSINVNGAMEFSSVSERLADDVAFLVTSLGGWTVKELRQTYYTHKGERRAGQPSFRIRIRLGICPFRLARKAERFKAGFYTDDRVVHSIKPIDSDHATCISVAHESKTFVTAHGVVTHNTTASCQELAFHLTGEYPHWWEGKRFDHPIEAWAASIDWKDIREGIQAKLFGKETDIGSGIIPRWAVDPDRISKVASTNGAIDKAFIRHKSGGWSELQFKTYAAGRISFQAVSRHVILLDEEPTQRGIFAECVTRTATVDGIVMLSFTSLLGVTPLVMKFLPELGKPPEEGDEIDDFEVGDSSHMASVMCGWDDVPHLPEKMRKVLLAAYNEHEKKARTTGWPGLSAGMVYPVEESEFVIAPIVIPRHWPRCAGLDPGWNKTAAVWLAIEPETNIAYLYSEYYRGQVQPEIHVIGISARGEWIPMVSDNAKDLKGNSIIDEYNALGKKMGMRKIIPAKKSGKDVRLGKTLSRLSTGRLKVFNTCQHWLWEFRQYRTDEHGEITSPNDHLMNATEYAVESGIPIAEAQTPAKQQTPQKERTFGFR